MRVALLGAALLLSACQEPEAQRVEKDIARIEALAEDCTLGNDNLYEMSAILDEISTYLPPERARHYFSGEIFNTWLSACM